MTGSWLRHSIWNAMMWPTQFVWLSLIMAMSLAVSPHCHGNQMLVDIMLTRKHLSLLCAKRGRRWKQLSYMNSMHPHNTLLSTMLSVHSSLYNRRWPTQHLNMQKYMGPVFGYGHDIYIRNKADKVDDNSCRNHTYRCSFAGELAGKEKFRVINYEGMIWRCIHNKMKCH